MQKNDPRYAHLVQILREELVPAMGCTEPISIAYGAAKARAILGRLPERVEVLASGNIIKNVKSVVVPNTGGLKGIEAAAAAGIVAGKEEKILEVISEVADAQKEEIASFLNTCPIRVKPDESDVVFSITLTLSAGADAVRLQITDYHTHIVLIEKNGEVLLKDGKASDANSGLTDRSVMSVEVVCDFADTCDLDDVRGLVEQQIAYNYAIAEEGMANPWGANIGKVIRDCYGQDIQHRARYMAAAASDARMSGCEMPVIIVSGSGNQGITASVPVAVFARETCKTEEELLRAVALSDLVTIHQKAGIGRLSAYCGAISAGCGAGAGIAYLQGGKAHAVAHTVVNAIAILSGTICDGAKPSCAAKIAAAVDAGILGYNMYLEGQQFYGGDGIITKGVDNTVRNVGILAREGMRQTDRTILEIMLNNG